METSPVRLPFAAGEETQWHDCCDGDVSTDVNWKAELAIALPDGGERLDHLVCLTRPADVCKLSRDLTREDVIEHVEDVMKANDKQIIWGA